MNPMFSSLGKTSPLLIIAGALALSGSAPASASEPDAAMAETIPCVSVVSNTLDLQILQATSDVWLLDIGKSINSEDGSVSLQVATGGTATTLSMIFNFQSLAEQASVRDSGGNEVQVVPDSSMSPIPITVSLVDEKPLTILATSSTPAGPNKPPGSNKAVLQPVKTCPRVF
jgi:hypothetical protein